MLPPLPASLSQGVDGQPLRVAGGGAYTSVVDAGKRLPGLPPHHVAPPKKELTEKGVGSSSANTPTASAAAAGAAVAEAVGLSKGVAAAKTEEVEEVATVAPPAESVGASLFSKIVDLVTPPPPPAPPPPSARADAGSNGGLAEAVYSSEAEYTAAFDVLDFDKDGFLSLEHQEKGPTHSAAYAAQFEALDVDKDRKLSRKEYHAGFAQMDMDRNGVLDKGELPHTRDLSVPTATVSEGEDANASPTALSEARVPSAHAEAAPVAPRPGAEGARLGAHEDGGEGGGVAVEETGGSERPLLYTSPAPAMPAKLGEDPLYVALPALRMPPDAWDGGDVPLAAEHIEADAAFESLDRWLGRHDALAAAPAGSTARPYTLVA